MKSSPFMGAQKLECEPEKNNISLVSNAIHRTAQTAKIDLSEFHGLLYEIEFAIYAREVFWWDKHKMRTSRCGVTDYAIFLPILYDIILVTKHIHLLNLC